MIDQAPTTERDFAQLPPHDLSAEMAAIGSMMLCGDDRATFDATRTILRSQMFYQTDHAVYFDAACRLADQGSKIDGVIMRAEMARAGLLEECGGQGYLAQLINSVPSPAHGPSYAKIVREKYIWREMIRISNNVLRRAYAPGKFDRSQDAATEFLSDLASIAHVGAVEKVHRMDEIVMAYLEMREKEPPPRVPSGLADLDELIGGIPKGKFTQIGGRPAMGKSLLAKQIVLNVSGCGINCGIITIEEDREKIVQNYLANLADVENNRVAYGRTSQDEWARMVGAAPALSQRHIFIADEPTRLSEVEGAITTMAVIHKCELIVVDYLQLIDPGTDSESENREITQISKTLKQAFRRNRVAGVAAVQLNRGNESSGIRKPTLRDLRGSGSLEQDGDLIILLHREDYYRKNDQNYVPSHQLEAIIAKNKDGNTGSVPLHFSGKFQRIADWQTQDPFAGHIRPPQAIDDDPFA